MKNWNVDAWRDEKEKRVYNAFSDERFFDYEDTCYTTSRMSTPLDKLAVIDEMITANITELTHRARED